MCKLGLRPVYLCTDIFIHRGWEILVHRNFSRGPTGKLAGHLGNQLAELLLIEGWSHKRVDGDGKPLGEEGNGVGLGLSRNGEEWGKHRVNTFGSRDQFMRGWQQTGVGAGSYGSRCSEQSYNLETPSTE